ncbi:Subtilisin-like protease [Sparassis crispa]|uniref:Subtilisin-like protease n=1 Tax=Sparassis crispa TaxID=139825 RepID=A0A401GFF0_9APHY|nr:Subtilisin-like protease [Sparassis crispa]GBE80855.1 Subtilisin-like protease [Sparassis crispa]
MSSLILTSLLAVSLAASGFATPLSTHPYDIPSERSSIAFAPLMVSHHPHGSVNNSYIVMFKDGISTALMQNHWNFLQAVHVEHPLLDDVDGLSQVYDGHVKGYAGKFSEGAVQRIRQMPEVDFVEADQIVRTLDIDVDAHVDAVETQKSAPWGLARISHRAKLTFGTFSKYLFSKEGGSGVDVYVIDTGVNIRHVEFEGRAYWGKTIPQGDTDEDANGHGTHCSGTIASRKYGVAKAANIIAVKVLGSNGSGSMSDVVGGVVWAAQSAAAKAVAAAKELALTGKTKHKGSVANMSLGGGKSRALDDTVNKAVDQGMHFAVAAGNDNRDACNNSPAAAEKAVTVGASTLGDERAYFSNFGPCVDVFAPGLQIRSTYIGSDTAESILSGTSMASPHTAGLLAYLLSIYPSSTFDPFVSPDLVPPSPLLQGFPSTSFSSIYALTHASLPGWVSIFLPPPQLVEEALLPVPKTMTPKQLKVALLALATEDALSVIPTDTPNLLIFNNATA